MENKLEIKTNYQNLKDLEFYLFSLVYEKDICITVSFYDSEEVYSYKTIDYENKKILVTI